MIPTPGVAVLARSSQRGLGCVISASHNPYQDNGIKFLGGDGRKLTDADEAEIEELAGDEHDASGGAPRPWHGRRRARTSTGWPTTYGDGVPARRGARGRLRKRRRARRSRRR